MARFSSPITVVACAGTAAWFSAQPAEASPVVRAPVRVQRVLVDKTQHVPEALRTAERWRGVGLSGLTWDPTTSQLWAVAESGRWMVALNGRDEVWIPLRGLPADVDAESIAWLAPDLFLLGTESRHAVRTGDPVFLVHRGAEQAEVVGTWMYADYAAHPSLTAASNRGLESLCVADRDTLAAVEVRISTPDGPVAPVVRLGPDGQASWFHVRLTSEAGRLAGMTCARSDGAIRVFALERHFATRRVIAFDLPDAANPRNGTVPVVAASVAYDLSESGALPDAYNPEGLAWTSHGIYLLNDNSYGGRTMGTVVHQLPQKSFESAFSPRYSGELGECPMKWLWMVPVAAASWQDGLGGVPVCEPSAMADLGDRLIVADNEVRESLFSFVPGADEALDVSTRVAEPLPDDEAPRDIEALVALDDELLVFGSFSRNSRCEPKRKRRRIKRVAPTSTGWATVADLRVPEDWNAAMSSVTACESTFFVPGTDGALAVCSALIDAERSAVDGDCTTLNLEGASAVDGRVWVGLRSPLSEGRAILLRLTPELDAFRFDAVQRIRLGGYGIRELTTHGSELWALTGPSRDGDVPHSLVRIDTSGSWTVDPTSQRDVPAYSEGLVVRDGRAWIVVDGGEPEADPTTCDIAPQHGSVDLLAP